MPSRSVLSAATGVIVRPRIGPKYVCSTCLLRRAARLLTSSAGPRNAEFIIKPSSLQIFAVGRPKRSLVAPWTFQTRSQSSTPSPRPTTAINAPSPIPPSTRALHAALLHLEREAVNYVPLSRLKLALRSLETRAEDTVIRIAILGIGSDKNARRLARCLLADVLSTTSSWEEVLEDDIDGKALLLRYGEDNEFKMTNSAFREVSVPSELLRKHNLELMISSIQVDVSQTLTGNGVVERSVLDNLLAPTLFAPASSAGGYSSVTHPVHKTMILGNGLKDLLALGRFLAMSDGRDLPSDLVKLAILDNITARAASSDAGLENVAVLNLAEAEKAIIQFRQSVNNALDYEHSWFSSHVPSLASWFSPAAENKAGLKHPLRIFIDNIIADVNARIGLAVLSLQSQSARVTVPEKICADLDKAITGWAEHAHAELRDALEISLHGNWNKLKWWKIFWRVDDVEMICSDILENKWLVNAEKELIFITGRMKEAGLLSPTQFSKPPSYSQATAQEETSMDIEQPLISKPQQMKEVMFSSPVTSVPPISFIPYPQQIPFHRSTFLQIDVSTLQTVAHKRVFEFLSTVSATTSLSVLIYLSSALGGAYEAGAIGALGLVYALRRLQTKWEDARSAFKFRLREDGRRVLLGTEDEIRAAVRQGGRTMPDDVLLESVEKAKNAVGRVKDALTQMTDGN